LAERGDIRSSSFSFQVYQDDFEYNVGDQLVRHLISARLIDTAPTAIPAYPDSTAALRSLSDHRGADFDEVRSLAAQGNLGRLFVRSDQHVAAPVTVEPGVEEERGMNGRQAQLELHRMTMEWDAQPMTGRQGLLELHRIQIEADDQVINERRSAVEPGAQLTGRQAASELQRLSAYWEQVMPSHTPNVPLRGN
jgi:hypothetical protein